MGAHSHEHINNHEHEIIYRDFGIVFLCYFILIVPFIAYQLKVFFNYRYKPIIKKRKPILNTLYITTLLITATLIRPALLIVSILGFQIHELAMTIRVGCLFISGYLFSFRTYCIIYDFNYNLAIFKKRCLAAVLSRDYDYQNWFLSHKKTWGNTKFMSPFVLIYILIMGAAAFILALINLFWCKMFVFSNFIIAILGYLLMSKYIIAHRDQFFVKKEIIYTACVWLFLVCVYSFLFFIKIDYGISNDIRDLILYIIETISTTILMLISTWWINRKCTLNNTINSNEFKHLHNISQTQKKLDLTGTGTDDYLAMDKTLSHFQGYSLFMEYLLEELSLENLMFITEIVHLKHLFHKLQKKREKISGKKIKSTNKLSVSSARRTSSKNNDTSGDNSDNESKSDADISDNEEEYNDREESKSKSKSNTGHNTPGNSNTPDIYNHTQNDWKIIKRKYVLNPQDDHLPFISKSIYKSQIMKQPNFFKKIQMIFDKYILRSAEYEINIKFNQRRKLIEVYNKKYIEYGGEIDITQTTHTLTKSGNKIPLTPSSPSLSYMNNINNQPSPFRLTSISEGDKIDKIDKIEETKTPDENTNISINIPQQKSNNKKYKLNDEEYVMLNNDVNIDDIDIFNKSAYSIMQLLRGSYIEFCKTNEYQQFAQAYKGAHSLDIFTVFKGQSNVCCNCL